MKKIKVLIVFVVVLFSCDEEIKPLTFKTNEISKAFDAEITVILTKATTDNNISNAINTTIENEIIKAISDSKNIKTLDEALSTFNTEFVNFKKDFPEGEQSWSLNIESEVTYISTEIVTIALSIYTDKGGAHGNDTISFLNFDPNTGNLFAIQDIIENTEAFKTLAEKHFKSSLKSEDSDKSNIEDFFFGEPFQLPKNIGFTDDGLVLLYNVYEIASYDQGYTEFVIPFSNAKPYLKVN
ncbi:DUF3298 and DUF4163 domain-containing protein [Winogradskyella sp. UBA3174]|uniref:DUF3298 and DUF4163 domain-containing protein n=1 Tax=Winogradskyella sp. UBA3174 TaxID=1947785 RepID=UPI0025CD945F|nr:DUF3298 and DUF4163 domain-containing protein [Winogradskyella sp. UBA3174]